MANIVAAMAAHMTRATPSSATVLPMATSGDLGAWERMDDVIMGGNSSSGLEPAADGSGAVWKGDLIVEVGVAWGECVFWFFGGAAGKGGGEPHRSYGT